MPAGKLVASVLTVMTWKHVNMLAPKLTKPAVLSGGTGLYSCTVSQIASRSEVIGTGLRRQLLLFCIAIKLGCDIYNQSNLLGMCIQQGTPVHRTQSLGFHLAPVLR